MLSIIPVKIKALVPPQDDLFARLAPLIHKLKEGDIVALSSKVISIHEGRCVRKGQMNKDDITKIESDFYLPRRYSPQGHALHTLTKGVLIRSAGIDESNGHGHYILWPENPPRSAHLFLTFLKKKSKKKKLGIVITDSTSTPLHRGVTGFALSYAGFNPLYDYRGTKDIFHRKLKFSQANLADAVAAAAVLAMGEGREMTPVAIVRGVVRAFGPGFHPRRKYGTFEVPLKEDLFAPFLKRVPWRKGKGKYRC